MRQASPTTNYAHRRPRRRLQHQHLEHRELPALHPERCSAGRYEAPSSASTRRATAPPTVPPSTRATPPGARRRINWNNRPARTSAATDDKGAIAANSWVEYDVTSLVGGSGTYSFDLATDSTDGVYFSQREAATFRPELVVTTGAPDTQKPSAPGNLNANAIGPNRIDLGWLSSTDNVGVTGYNVYRGGTLLAGIGVTNSYSDTSVAPATTYSYQVRSLDAAGNISDPSNTAPATTPAAPAVLTFSPDADAIMRQASPTTNYATDVLGADFSTSTSNIESFLRFTVSGIPAGKSHRP